MCEIKSCVRLCTESTESAWDCLSPSLSAPPLSCSLSQNKYFFEYNSLMYRLSNHKIDLIKLLFFFNFLILLFFFFLKLDSRPQIQKTWFYQLTYIVMYKTCNFRGTWVVQSVEHPALDFGSSHDLMVCGFKPLIGLGADSVEPAWDSLSLSLSPCSTCSCSLKINTLLKSSKQMRD